MSDDDLLPSGCDVPLLPNGVHILVPSPGVHYAMNKYPVASVRYYIPGFLVIRNQMT